MLEFKPWAAVLGSVIGILLSVAFLIVNNRSATEKRAYVSAKLFVEDNGIKTKRLSCAGDSDRDGNGTCNILTLGGEKISLECPTDFFDVNVWGATGCKEVLVNLNFQGYDGRE